MEALIVIYQCQDKAYRLKWDEPLKGEIENIAINEQDKRECRNAGALLELLRMIEQPEVYEVVDLMDARGLSFINESENSQQFKVYPNPGTNFINIQTPLVNETMMVTIFDLSGKIILTSYNNSSDYMLLDISEFSKGMYLIQVETNENEAEVQKLIIE
jgi:hypothetical protein